MTTVEQDRELAQADGLLDALRAAEAELRRSYSRMLAVVAELDVEKVAAVTGFGTTPRLLAGVLNLSKGEAKSRAEQAKVLTARRSLIGEPLPPAWPATAAELAAGTIGPAHVRVITAVMRQLPDAAHPETAAQAEQTLAHAARRFDPAALTRIGERLLAHLDPDGTAPADEPETLRELRVRTRPDGTVSLNGQLDPEGGAQVLEVLGSLNGRRAPIDGVPDTRSQARRDADALVEAMSRLLDDGELPTRGGNAPTWCSLWDCASSSMGWAPQPWTPAGNCPPPKPVAWPAMPGSSPWSSAATPCPSMLAASSAWPAPLCGMPSPSATKDVVSRGADAHPVTATPTTSCRGSTGAPPLCTICAFCVSGIMSSCTAKDGTSDSTPAATPNSPHPKPSTPGADHSTIHCDNKNRRGRVITPHRAPD